MLVIHNAHETKLLEKALHARLSKTPSMAQKTISTAQKIKDNADFLLKLMKQLRRIFKPWAIKWVTLLDLEPKVSLTSYSKTSN
jgi:hypothetical protein